MNYLAFVKRSLCLLSLLLALPLSMSPSYAQKEKSTKVEKSPKVAAPASYRELILADQPTLYWNFETPASEGYNSVVTVKEKTEPVKALISGKLAKPAAGPRPSEFPLFTTENQAAAFQPGEGFLRVVDPGEKSILDFTAGDAITLEAWVNLNSTKAGRHYYIIGKGRTAKGLPVTIRTMASELLVLKSVFCFGGNLRRKIRKPISIAGRRVEPGSVLTTGIMLL